jgi:hypothetical protein
MSAARKAKANSIIVIPWSASGKVLRPTSKDFQNKTNAELFENAKAQAWWKARDEFRNTYRSCNNKDFDSTQLVHIDKSISNKAEKLIRELSQPRYKLSASGKLMVDKKPKGTRSPNIADAYIMCRAEVKSHNIEMADFNLGI